MKQLNNFMKVLKFIWLFLAILLPIDVSWVVYEVLRFGKSTPNPFHTVIAIILSLSILLNVSLIKSRTKNLP